MANTHRWLQQQIRQWRDESIITAEQAEALSARYPVAGPSQPWGKVIVSAFGAIILGLGVILFFAYNWQAMHRWAKLGLVLSALVAAHAGGWWLTFKSSNPRLGESLHLLGTVLFGAGIWLVAQIYHIDAHYPNGLLLWALGALAMAWALMSPAQGMLALAVLAAWGGFEAFDFNAAHFWPSWLIVVGIVPLAWIKRSTVLLFFSGVLLILSYLVSTAQWEGDFVFLSTFAWAVLYLFGGALLARYGYDEQGAVIRKVGWFFYLILGFIFTFNDAAKELYLADLSQPAWILLHAYLPVLLAFVFGIVALIKERGAAGRYAQINDGLAFASFLLMGAASLFLFELPGLVALLFNVIFFTHGVVFLLLGMQLVDWRRVAVGGALLAALIFARFMDLFDSLLVRSLVFIVLGAGLLLLGWYFTRRKEQEVPHG